MTKHPFYSMHAFEQHIQKNTNALRFDNYIIYKRFCQEVFCVFLIFYCLHSNIIQQEISVDYLVFLQQIF